MKRLWVFLVIFGFMSSPNLSISDQESGAQKETSKEAPKEVLSEGIEWLKDLDQGMKQSAKEGRPVITYFTYDT